MSTDLELNQLRSDVTLEIASNFIYVTAEDEQKHCDGFATISLYGGHLILIFLKGLGAVGSALGGLGGIVKYTNAVKAHVTKEEQRKALERQLKKISKQLTKCRTEMKQLKDLERERAFEAGKQSVINQLVLDQLPKMYATKHAEKILELVKSLLDQKFVTPERQGHVHSQTPRARTVSHGKTSRDS